jgi:hypothetical protein
MGTATARAIVHVGTQKTGSTSLQAWLDLSRSALEEKTSVRLYEGLFGSNHYEFGLLSARPSRNGFGEREFPDWRISEWRSEATDHIRAQVDQSIAAGTDLLVSSEVISLLRNRDEIEEFQELLSPLQVSIVVVLRDPAEFLKSYRRQIGPGRWSRYEESAGYTEPDSWLVDYEGMIDAFQSVFGENNVSTVNYEDSLEHFGSVIPAVALAAGLPLEQLPPWLAQSWDNPSADRTPDVFDALGDENVFSSYTMLARKVESRSRENVALMTYAKIIEAQAERQEQKQKSEQAQMQTQASQLQHATSLNEALTSSLSWRITTPLRKLKSLIKR